MTLTPSKATIAGDVSSYAPGSSSTLRRGKTISTIDAIFETPPASRRPLLPVYEMLRDGLISEEQALEEIDAIPGWTDRLAAAEAEIDAREAEGR